MNNINNPITDFVDQLLNRSVSEVVNKDFLSTKPNVNILKQEDSYIIKLAAPGLNKEDFKIQLNEDKLSISTDVQINEDDNMTFSRKEYDFHKFKRTFIIPDNIDLSGIKATYKLGVLELKLLKKSKIDHEVVHVEIK